MSLSQACVEMMLFSMISQIDIVVVKLSHDVASCGVSAACTYVDLILDIFDGFFFFFHGAFVSGRFIYQPKDIGFRRSIFSRNVTFSPHLHVCQTIFLSHCQLNIVVDFSM